MTTNENPSDEKLLSIIERIKKLLHLAHGSSGATEAEAGAAMEAAQRLLLKYNLERVNLDANGVAKPEPLGHEDIQITNENWRRDLLRAVAKANLCRTVNRTVARSYKTWIPATVHVIGKPTNRAAAIEIFNWIVAQIEGVQVGTKVNGDPLFRGGLYSQSWSNKPEDVKWRDWRFGFFTGITERLSERLDALVADEVLNTPGAMVLVNQTELVLKSYWASDWSRGGRLGDQRTGADNGAHGLGRAAGDRVTLHKSGLGSGTRGRLGSGR